MTVKQLSQLFYLRREIELDQKRLEALEKKEKKYRRCCFSRPDIERAIVEYRSTFRMKRERVKCEYAFLSRFLELLPDPWIKQQLTWGCIGNKSWQQIATAAGNNTNADAARMACNRYLKSPEAQALEENCRAWTIEHYPEGAAALWPK